MGKITEDDYIGTPAIVLFEHASELYLKALECQKAQRYEDALVKYNSALGLLETFFKFCESDTNIVSLPSKILFLFLLFDLVDKVKNCYGELREPYKFSVFQNFFWEIIETIGKYEKALNPKQVILYKNITKATKSTYENIPLAEFTTAILEETSQVGDNSDDPTFIEMVSNYDKCCSYKTLLMPSKGVSISSSSSSCFIATAAYSTSTHPDIDTFRNFRDKKLLTNPVGKGLVSLYYKISPSIANYVKKQPVIKSFLRQQLERLAEWMRSQEIKS
ncbi:MULTISPECIES: CFI-box-CTERM domain-containing protein [unclassified Microcoleus]|uniref:CFI-box-CTERM domain-containing protein n=1 Tax=unclassified Microcoleus TaxID=2642155 RepID=UPI002FD093E0